MALVDEGAGEAGEGILGRVLGRGDGDVLAPEFGEDVLG